MKARILIVDDSKILQSVIKRIVENAGHEVVGCAEDGEKALERFHALKPDLVLMDVTMPNMSGTECLAELMEISPQTPVIMISGLSDPKVEEECLRLGAKAFVSKSDVSNLEMLEKKIHSTLSRIAA